MPVPAIRQRRLRPFLWLLWLGASVAAAADITYTRDVAPILFEHCVSCHRPGEAAPFPLLTYDDARRRAKMIAEVTAKRTMPPWMPDSHPAGWIGERRLSTNEIARLKGWFDSGMAEGAASDLPKRPEFTDGWQLGKPDLIVEMPEAFVVPAEGKDVYRSFAIDVPLKTARRVRALEFRPDNRRVVHHAFVLVDSTGAAKARQAKEKEPGFPGIMVDEGPRMPTGQFLSWQPGRGPSISPPGFPWEIAPGMDLVLQLHMSPTGKPEPLKASVGLYFSDQEPTRSLLKIGFAAMSFELKPGEARTVVEDRRVLPVDCEVYGVLPHSHYLGREVEGVARLPDGSERSLVHIREWDFNWQSDYQYRNPVFLPKGTELSMRWVFDNSTNNLKNPHQPPKPVFYGKQSSDEMCELWFQVLCKNSEERSALDTAFQNHLATNVFHYRQISVHRAPNDPEAHMNLGLAYLHFGQPVDASNHFVRSLQLEPKQDRPHYNLGVIARSQGRQAEAQREFEAAIAINPDNAKAHGNLGLLLTDMQKLDAAEEHFLAALRLNPADKVAAEMIRRLKEFKASQQPAKQ